MQLHDEAPRLPKLPFLVGDGLLLLTAAFIASRSADPIGTIPLLGIALCVGLGSVLAIIPFLVDYARRQDDAIEERQRALSALSRDISAAAEQISIAAGSLPGLTQHAAQTAKLADQLPKLIQDKIHHLKEALAEANDAEIENLRQELAGLRSAETEKLESSLDKIDRIAGRLDELLKRWEQLPAQTEAAARELQTAIKAAAKTRPHKSAEPAPRAEPAEIPPAAPSAPSPQPEATTQPEPTSPPEPAASTNPASPEPVAEFNEAAPPPPQPAQAIAVAAVESVEVVEEDASPAPAAEPPPPPPAPKHAAPRRKAPPPIDDNPDLFETHASDDEPAESSSARSADGATRLIVTAYIGIGNKLYLRGEGPGLNPDHGIPLQFVSIGKWRWETDHADAPLKIRLYKNDQIECTTLGEVVLKPGHQHEVGATF